MPLDPAFEAALGSDQAIPALRDLAKEFASQGHDPGAILAQFEGVRELLRQQGREADEDAVMDVMDCLVGWCAPAMALPHPPGPDDVEGRTKIHESMVEGENTPEAGTPASFDVPTNEIRGLGLNMQLEKKRV